MAAVRVLVEIPYFALRRSHRAESCSCDHARSCRRTVSSARWFVDVRDTGSTALRSAGASGATAIGRSRRNRNPPAASPHWFVFPAEMKHRVRLFAADVPSSRRLADACARTTIPRRSASQSKNSSESDGGGPRRDGDVGPVDRDASAMRDRARLEQPFSLTACLASLGG